MTGHRHPRTFTLLLAGMAALVLACGKESPRPEGAADSPAAREPAQATESSGTGKTIVVEMYSDAAGNYFKPKKVEAHQGDVVRFVLKSGVHNVNFLPALREFGLVA